MATRNEYHRRPTLAQKVGAQAKDPLTIYDTIDPEQEDAILQMAQEMAQGADFDPETAGKGPGGDLTSDDVFNEYKDFGASDVNDMYDSVGRRSKADYDKMMAEKSGSGEGMRGYNQFESPEAAMGRHGEIPEKAIEDIMTPQNESEDVLYGLTGAQGSEATGGAMTRPDVKSGKTAGGEDLYDVLGKGSPKAVVKEKEKTTVVPGGLAKNPFPEDSKLGRMFRQIEARGKPNGHGLGRVKRPKF